jgi:hypothetical protein
MLNALFAWTDPEDVSFHHVTTCVLVLPVEICWWIAKMLAQFAGEESIKQFNFSALEYYVL